MCIYIDIQHIRDVLKTKNISVKEFSEITGYSHQHISSILRGKNIGSKRVQLSMEFAFKKICS